MFRINNTFVNAILKRWNIFTSRYGIIIVGKILLKSVGARTKLVLSRKIPDIPVVGHSLASGIESL